MHGYKGKDNENYRGYYCEGELKMIPKISHLVINYWVRSNRSAA